MKTTHPTHLSRIVIPVLAFLILPAVWPAGAFDSSLTAECSSNRITLYWYGGPGYALQQTTSLVDPVWRDVPGTLGMSFCEQSMTNTMAFFRVANVDALRRTPGKATVILLPLQYASNALRYPGAPGLIAD